MSNSNSNAQIYMSFLKAIQAVGISGFKSTTLFGRNDENAQIGVDKAA